MFTDGQSVKKILFLKLSIPYDKLITAYFTVLKTGSKFCFMLCIPQPKNASILEVF